MKMNQRQAALKALWVGIVFAAVMMLFGAPVSVLADQTTTLTGLQDATFSNTDARTETLRALLKGFTERDEVPGAALLLAHHGRVVFREAYGWADVKDQTPFTVQTQVLIASVTKPISATCLMTLVDQGKLALDDRVSKYLPAFDGLTIAETGARAASPTVRQLLSHTSGIYGLVGASKEGMRAVRDLTLSLTESVDIIAREKLVAEPGQRFNYGGANYQVAARIAEIVSGQSFDNLMQTQLLKPLNLAETYFRPGPAQDLGKVATTYSFAAGKGLVPIRAYGPDPNRRLILASGGLYSSLNDLAVFLQMHLNGGNYDSARVLTPASVAEMQKIQTPDSEVRYGLGWFIDRTTGLGKTESISHPGLFGAVIWIDKDRELVGVFLTTSLWPGKKQLNDELRKTVLELFPVGS